MFCRASRRLDVGPTSLDGSTADREVARSGPTTPKSIDPSVLRSIRRRAAGRALSKWNKTLLVALA